MVGSVLVYLRRNVLACTALFLALGGTSYAVTNFTSTGGKFSGCVGAGGALRLIKPAHHCPRGQTAVGWSSTGPAGARGATGAQGVQGPSGQSITGAPGATGPSDAYTNSIPGHSLKLPAGDYELFGKASWKNATSEPQTLKCVIYDDTFKEFENSQQTVPALKPATITLVVPLHLSQAEAINFECALTPNENGEFGTFQFTAIKIGTLHTQ
jgi:hypothetical protein